jgi:hypothetical protein
VGTFTIGASMSPWVQEGPVAPYIVGSEPWDATVGGGVAAGGSRRWLCLQTKKFTFHDSESQHSLFMTLRANIHFS